jgi:hypothetical protein
MTLIKASASHSSSNNMYYVDTEGFQQQGKPAMLHFEDLLAQLKLWVTETSRDDQLRYAHATATVKNNIFITINEFEKCTTIDEAIRNWLCILSRNERQIEITKPLTRLYSTDGKSKNLPEIIDAYNKLVASSDVQYEIQRIYEKLLPRIAKRNNRDMQDYADMGVWYMSWETIKTNVLISHIKGKIDTVREEQEAIQARFMYLSYISRDPKKALLGKINALSENKFEDVLIKHDTGSTSSTTLNIELVPVDKSKEHCYIRDITASKSQVTYTKGWRSYPRHPDDIMAVIMGEAKAHFKLS